MTLERKFLIKIFTQIDRWWMIFSSAGKCIWWNWHVAYYIFRHMNECHFGLLYSIWNSLFFFVCRIFTLSSLETILSFLSPFISLSNSQFVTWMYIAIHVQHAVDWTSSIAEKFIIFPSHFFFFFSIRHRNFDCWNRLEFPFSFITFEIGMTSRPTFHFLFNFPRSLLVAPVSRPPPSQNKMSANIISCTNYQIRILDYRHVFLNQS